MILTRAIGDALAFHLANDPRVVVLGEDIADPYGGAFKVTRGLSTRFPSRVKTTPVSEQAITGLAAGLALSGYRPILEFMFGDFISLAFDQILNHITKFQSMYAGSATCPVIIRLPSGGGRGYGPTHSQSLEKHFLGIPNLLVTAASPYIGPRKCFEILLGQDKPAIFIEHKRLYPEEMRLPIDSYQGDFLCTQFDRAGFMPTVSLSMVPREQCSVTLVTYGFHSVLAASLIKELALTEELFVELLVVGQLAPFFWEPILESAERTGLVATAEEGTQGNSWGTEVAAGIHHNLFSRLKKPVRILTSASDIIPTARHLEASVLLNPATMSSAILELAQ